MVVRMQEFLTTSDLSNLVHRIRKYLPANHLVHFMYTMLMKRCSSYLKVRDDTGLVPQFTRSKRGDVLGAPCGRAEFAHKLTNTGTQTLKYLAISTLARTDVCEYPDSGKFAVGTRSNEPEEFGYIGRDDDPLDYWEGEPDSAY